MPRRPHNYIENHWLTELAARQEYGPQPSLDDVLNASFLPAQRMVMMEQILLRKWRGSFRGRHWEDYFDSSLTAHADAALSLSWQYDAVVGIGRAAIPYTEIFRWLSFPIFYVDYSHRNGNLSHPVLSEDEIEELRGEKMVLLVNSDLRTGKTLTDVACYLGDHCIKVGGAYIGLSCWPGRYSTNFSTFWKRCGSTRQIFKRFPHRFRPQLIPSNLRLYTSVLTMPDDKYRRLTSVLRVARHLREREQSCSV